MIVFDLDGTLIDSSAGIVSSLRYALGRVGCENSESTDLRWCIGPPIRKSVDLLVSDEATKETAVEPYYSHFELNNVLNFKVFDGVSVQLDVLGNRFPLFVATSKNEQHAKRVLRHAGLAGYFTGIFGAEPKGQAASKREVLENVLRVAPTGYKTILMVGDRAHDVWAARSLGFDAIGVTYGFGSRQELTDAGCTSLCDTPSELAEAVFTNIRYVST